MTEPTAPRAALTPETALILAILLPGVGQFYNGQFWKGLLVALTSPLIIPWIWGAYDAFQVTKRIVAGEIEPRRSGCLFAFVCFLAVVVIIPLAIGLAIGTAIVMLGLELPAWLTELAQGL